jgi:formylglycine-generating enzyme required for sulfatase activity
MRQFLAPGFWWRMPVPCSTSILRILTAALLAALGVLAPFDAGQAQAPKAKKFALLVGVRAYDHRQLTELKYTENDVEELSGVLRKSGFKTVVMTTTKGEKRKQFKPTAANIRKQLKEMLKKVTKHDTMLLALSGHGLQFELEEAGKRRDESFFCPADARPGSMKSLKELSETMLSFTEVFKLLDESGVGVKLLLVDACRNEADNFRSTDVDVLPRPTKGTAALFSCKSGERSFEKAELKHGIFFHFVIEGLRGKAMNERTREVTWDRLAEYVKRQVSRESPKLIKGGARQTPHEIRNLEGDSPLLAERVGLIGKWPKVITNSIGMKLVRIPAGAFTMGSPKTEKGRGDDEEQHAVEITREFWMGVYEVTQKEFTEVMKYNPSYYSTDPNPKGQPGTKYPKAAPGDGKAMVAKMDTSRFPVENVSVEEAIQFCEGLSKREKGRAYRLPTEAEWEYACRGNAPTYQVFHFGNSLALTQANCRGTYPTPANTPSGLERTCKVGSYKPNGFGLHDMHGNVWEWCSDWYQKDYQKDERQDPRGPKISKALVVRGGAWMAKGEWCRSAHRSQRGSRQRGGAMGFRVVLVPADR